MCTYIVIAAVCCYLNMPTSTCGDCISWGGYGLQRCPIQLLPVLRGDIDKLWTRIVTTRTWGIYARTFCPSTCLCTCTFHTLKEWRSAGRGSAEGNKSLIVKGDTSYKYFTHRSCRKDYEPRNQNSGLRFVWKHSTNLQSGRYSVSVYRHELKCILQWAIFLLFTW